MHRICQGILVRNVGSFDKSFSVKRQHSEPYRRVGKIYQVHIESSLPFGTLLNNISQRENMIDTTPSSPEPCLVLAKFMVHRQ